MGGAFARSGSSWREAKRVQPMRAGLHVSASISIFRHKDDFNPTQKPIGIKRESWAVQSPAISRTRISSGIPFVRFSAAAKCGVIGWERGACLEVEEY